MKRYLSFAACCAALMCRAASPTLTPAEGYPRFALGADVSWTPYIEAKGIYTYYTDGSAAEFTSVPAMLYDHGIDAVRLRVWVDPTVDQVKGGFTFRAYGYTYEAMPTYGTCSADEMVALAHRFASQGQRIMVSFHFSDTWADPGRQFIPKSWAGCTSVDELAAKAAEHVTEVLQRLHDANVRVEWVQLGNEVNNGMLKWELPDGSGREVSELACGCSIDQTAAHVPSPTTYNFVKVFASAAEAARGIYPEVHTVLHLTKTAEWDTLNWSLDLLVRAGLTRQMCDYVGLSLYPGIDDGQDNYTARWRTYADLGISTIKRIEAQYGMRTLLCEIGLNNEYSLSANVAGVGADALQRTYIEQCNADVRDFTQYLIETLATDDSPCDGLFYWEPETDYLENYKKGACVSVAPGSSWPRDRVTANEWWRVVAEHSSFPAGGLIDYTVDGMPDAICGSNDTPAIYYDMQGRIIGSSSPGLYIERRGPLARKVVIKR